MSNTANPPSSDTDGSQNDRRRFRRIPYEADVQLVQGSSVWPTDLEDISLNGLLVKEPDSWQKPDEPIEVRVQLTDEWPVKEISMKAKLIHSTEGSLGLEQVEIDSQSLTELRHILEHQIGQGRIERELNELVGQKAN